MQDHSRSRRGCRRTGRGRGRDSSRSRDRAPALPAARVLATLLALAAVGPVAAQPPNAAPQPPDGTRPAAGPGFVGGLRGEGGDGALPVRHDVHRAGTEIVTLRYFKIREGRFDEFLRASVDGVWPFYEKLGARVIGMWRVTSASGPPAADGDDGQPEFDEVYLATRYASVEHWDATREPQRLGGNGPDWEACRRALEVRRGLTLETRLTFLEGAMASNGPYFQPALPESYRRVEEDP